MQKATGSFDVNMLPQPRDEHFELLPVGRVILDKQYHGDLEATSQGQMLSFMTDTEGSAGYVAIEQVTGSLDGREGTFALQHDGVMTRGDGQLSIRVVPDSGTGELAGISGTMTIDISEGLHEYTFEYALGDAQ